MIEIHCIVSGRVQGVLYRRFAAREAERLSLVGAVHNESDGTVSVVAQGDDAICTEYISVLQKGPFFSSVAGIVVKKKEIPARTMNDFRIIW